MLNQRTSPTLLAGVGSGVFKTVDEACQTTIAGTARVRISKKAATYERYYPHYPLIYAALSREFKGIAQIVENRHSVGG